MIKSIWDWNGTLHVWVESYASVMQRHTYIGEIIVSALDCLTLSTCGCCMSWIDTGNFKNSMFFYRKSKKFRDFISKIPKFSVLRLSVLPEISKFPIQNLIWFTGNFIISGSYKHLIFYRKFQNSNSYKPETFKISHK